MGKRRSDGDAAMGVLIGVGVAAVAGLGTLLLHYFTSGVGEADALFIPNSIEARVDRVVEALNQRFGKRWVNSAVSTLRAGLATVLPAPLVAMVDVVHRVEQVGQHYGWNGFQKRNQAVASYPA